MNDKYFIPLPFDLGKLSLPLFITMIMKKENAVLIPTGKQQWLVSYVVHMWRAD